MVILIVSYTIRPGDIDLIIIISLIEPQHRIFFSAECVEQVCDPRAQLGVYISKFLGDGMHANQLQYLKRQFPKPRC